MIKVYSNAMKEASDFLNRVKGNDVYLKSINEQVYFVSSIDSVWAYFDLNVQTKEDIDFEVDIGKTVDFNRLIKYFEKDGLDITMEFKDSEVVISNSKRDLRRPIKKSNISSYVKGGDSVGVNRIEGGELKEVIDRFDSLRGKDLARPELEGVRLNHEGFIALDGYVLGLYHKELDVKESFTINDAATTILKRLLVKHKGLYTIKEYEDYVTIETDNIIMCLNDKIKAVFDYERVINEDNFEFEISLGLDSLIDDMKYLSSSSEPTLTTITDEGMTNEVIEAGKEASTNNTYEHIQGEIPEDFSIYYNNSYMLKVLNLHDDEDVVISYKGGVHGSPSINPMLVTGEKYTGLVLPMRMAKHNIR